MNKKALEKLLTDNGLRHTLIRLSVLTQLSKKPLTIVELSKLTKHTTCSVSYNLKVLIKAGLVKQLNSAYKSKYELVKEGE